MKLLALASLMMVTTACVPRATEQPRVPTPPGHPSAPKPKFNPLRAPAAPHLSPTTGVAISAFPEAFPISGEELVVVALPSDSVVSPGSELEPREAFLTGLLQSGFRVKDAGYLTPDHFELPGAIVKAEELSTETEVRSRKEERPSALPRQAPNKASQARSPRLTDPTSLWALKLLEEKELNAKYLFRVFSFLSSKKTSKQVPTSLNEDRYARYLSAVQSYNDFLTKNERLIEEYRIATNNYRRAMDKYHADYLVYESRFAQYERAMKRHNARSEGRAPTAVRAPRTPIEDPGRIPQPVKPLTKEQIRALGLNQPIRVNVIHFLAELIDATSGEVLWTGEVQATGALEHRELVVRAIREVTASSQLPSETTEEGTATPTP